METLLFDPGTPISAGRRSDLVVSTILRRWCGGLSPVDADPVAEGDDEAATILDGEVPQTTSAPRVFGVTEAPEIDGSARGDLEGRDVARGYLAAG